MRVGADAAPEEALEPLYDRITLGGFVFVEGCEDAERRAAVDALPRATAASTSRSSRSARRRRLAQGRLMVFGL